MQVNPGEAFTIRREDGQFQCITGETSQRFCQGALAGLLNGIKVALVPTNKEKHTVSEAVVEVDPFLSDSFLSN